MRRELKVYGKWNGKDKEVPQIILQGKWLSDEGIEVGDSISVYAENGTIYVTKSGE